MGGKFTRGRLQLDWLTMRVQVSLLAALAVIVNAAADPAYPIKISANKRYVVDQNNQPFLMIGDAPHSLLVNLNESDAWTYLVNRGSNGFNSLWVELLAGNYVAGRFDGSMLDGTRPFTGILPGGEYDFTSPNEAYFLHVDKILRMAATNGMQVLLDPLETGDWTSVALANGVDRCRQYGQYLGNRYKSFPNIIWLTGNDFQTWRIPENDAVVVAIALGIKDMDTNHLQTVQLDYNVSESLDDPNWWPIISLNSVYTYYATYAETLNAYNHTNHLPVYLLEAHYEFENVGGEFGTPSVLRRQEYWSMLSGATAGHMYGNHYTWTFEADWENYLNSPGLTQLQYFKSFFESRCWYELVPDQNHSVLTAGYGTADTGPVGESNYATAARTTDGSLVVVYLPTRRTITVDMSKLRGPVLARWFDPVGGVYSLLPDSPFLNWGNRDFAPPGDNSAGEGDWVLALEAGDPETEPPTVTLTVPISGAVVSNIVEVLATASDNVGVVGVQFQVDGTNLQEEVLSEPYRILWSTPSVANGLHTVQAIARDPGGNTATNAVSVTVENPASSFFLSAAYGFNEGSGATVADASGKANTGTVSGATWTTLGRYDRALDFSGSAWVTVNDSSSLDLSSNGMTLEAWVYPSAPPLGWGTIILKEASGELAYALLLYAESGAIRPEVHVQTSRGLQSLLGTFGLALNTWSHIAGTYDGATLRLYLNGSESAHKPASGVIVISTEALRIGGNAIWGEYFVGTIDEVRVHSRALSQPEIQADVDAAIGVAPAITLQPESLLVNLGSNATYSVKASGSPPLSYQWYFNTNDVIEGATNDILVVTNVQDSQAGWYSVSISNSVNVVLSAPAQLVVNHPPVPASPILQRYPGGGVRVRDSLLLGTDSDGDSLALDSVVPLSAQGGSVSVTDGWVIYAPPIGLTDGDSFTYTVVDGRGGLAVGNVTIAVLSSNGPLLTLSAENVSDGTVRITGGGIPNRSYIFQFTESLNNRNWQVLGVVTSDDFGAFQYVDHPPTADPARFYRVTSF